MLIRTTAPPMTCLDQHIQLGSGTEANMHGLSLVSPASINTFKAGCPKGKKVILPDPHCTKSPLPTGRFHSCKVQSQSRNKVSVDKVPRSNALSPYPSSQSCLSYSGSYKLISEGCNNASSFDDSMIQKPVKRSKKRKTKREKKNKKVSSHAGSTNSQGIVCNESLTSEICGNNCEDKLTSGATSPEVSSSDGSVNKNDFDGRVNQINSSQATGPFGASINQAATLENAMSSVLQSLAGECFEIHSEDRIRKVDQGFSALERCLEESNGAQIHCFDHAQSKVLSVDGPDSLPSDSISVISSSNCSVDVENDVKSFDINRGPEPSVFLSLKCSRHRKWLANGNTEANGHSVFKKHGAQVSSTGDVQSPVSGKRRKQMRSLPMGSSVYKSVNTGKLPGRVVMENSRSVWQKVQRTCVEDSSCEQKKTPVRTQFKIRSKGAPPSVINNDHSEAISESNKEVNEQPKEELSKRLKTSGNLCLENCCCIEGECGCSNACSSDHASVGMQHNDIEQERCRLGNISVASLKPESRLSLQGDADSVEQQESSRNNQFNTEIDHEVLQDMASSQQSYTGESNLLKVSSLLNFPHLTDKIQPIEKDLTHAGNIKKNHTSASFAKKWVPIVSANPGPVGSERIRASSCENVPSVVDDGRVLRNESEEKLEYTRQDLVSSHKPEKDLTCGSGEDCINHSIPNLQQVDKLAVSSLSSELKKHSLSATKSEAESSKLIQAINAAYKVELKSEAIRATAGGPIAEFERILHCCSPIICESPRSLCCHNCPQNQVSGSTLCKHEIPDVKLGCLWHWYEEHGSYGLEVRAEDYQKSKRIGVDRFSFRAYFVPYLSAIQLFGRGRRQLIDNTAEVSSSGVTQKHHIGEISEESDGRCLSASSVPKPGIAAAGQSVELTSSDSVELLFEYFESDQPQQRRPLYEKIHELARSDGFSGGKLFGDPTSLVSQNLQDLHPTSWYSVAWYPIYKIPDGKFRAAFLTYHSLGHLVSRSAEFNSTSVDSWVVSPAVGLQSYNAQGECWFKLRPNEVTESEQIPSLNPSGILKERLRTLEVTASLMARATVNKGDKTSVNRQPDYEFFLSRRRY